jgi:hypothetical protein
MSYVAVASIGVSVVSSIIGGANAKKQAKKQMEMLWNLTLADQAYKEKLGYEQIRTEAETERIKIISNSVREYREALQKESTIRLRDTWIYIAALGCGTSAIYAVSLIYSKSNSNGG